MKDNPDDRVMASDPFAEDDVLARTFYSPGGSTPHTNGAAPNSPEAEELRRAESGKKKKKKKDKPTHYRVVSVSLYMDDIERIDNLVKELKRRGFTKMNRSALIRFAIDTVNLDDMPRQY